MVKSTLKRTVSLLLVLALVFGVLPMMSWAANVNTGVTGLGADSDGGTWTPSNGTITGTISPSSSSGCTGTTYNEQTGTLTFTNNSGGTALLSFDYSFSKISGSATVDGTDVTAGGNFGKRLEAGATVVISIKSGAAEGADTIIVISNLKLTPEQNVTVTFKAPVNGTYTVDGTSITADTSITKLTTESFTLAATAGSGYKFFGWRNVLQDTYLSTTTPLTISFTETTTVEPVFVSSTAPIFQVGAKLFIDLNEAINYASSSGTALIVLVADGTLPAGTYTLPSGKTLLIPFDAANTVYTTTPEVVYGSHTTPSAYRKLTMDNGANIVVSSGASLCVPSKLCATGTNSGSWNGTPSGPGGRINMNSGSSIDVKSGGGLYVYGYISGSGNVYARSGSTVYETFQIRCWRGGTATSNMADNSQKVFPINQYYVQNIEAPLTLYAGATEKVYTAVNMSSQAFSASATFIGSGGMFNLSDGSVTKRYTGTSDRLELNVNGSFSITPMSLKITGLPLIGTLDLNTSDYVLPINSNISINVKSGSTTFSQDVAFFPGTEMTIDRNASVSIASGHKAYIYDQDQWGAYAAAGLQLVPVGYSTVNGTTAKRTAANLIDSKIDVNGTLNVTGALYTTESGAAIVSSGGTGKVVLQAKAGTETTTYQATQSGSDISYVSIPITASKLQNADGSYYETAGAAAGTEIPYGSGRWGGTPTVVYTVKWFLNPDDTTPIETDEVNEGDQPVYDGAEPAKQATAQYTFTFDGWQKDGTGTVYTADTIPAASEDVSYYAHFIQTIRSYTITWKVEGQEDVTTTVEYGETPTYPNGIPEKNPGDGYIYTFKEWSPAITPVSGEAEYTAVFDKSVEDGYYLYGSQNNWSMEALTPDKVLTLNSEAQGEEWMINTTLSSGDTFKVVKIENGSVTRYYPDGENNHYTVDAAHAGEKTVFFRPGADGGADWWYNTIYVPINNYTITWKDDEGNVIDTSTVAHGTIPSHTDPVKEGNAQYSYTFTGWNPTPVAAVADAEYTATFSQTTNKYNITWKNDDGSVIETTQVEYGTVPSHDAPEKQNNDQYTYTFTGWDPEPVAVTGDAEYTATFSSTVNEYEIKFLDYDNTELQTLTVAYGDMPQYTGEMPERPATAQYTYIWDGWYPEVVPVTGPAQYVAVYEEFVNEYNVTWKNWDDEVFYSESVPYGTVPSYIGDTPTKASDTEHDYSFVGWTPDIDAVTEDVEYTAVFTATDRMYDVVWVVAGQEDVHSSWAYGSTPVYMVNGEPATPVMEADAQFTYTFIGWDPEITTVTGDATYVAQFSQTLNQYTVTWTVDGNSSTETYDYGDFPVYKIDGEAADPVKEGDAQFTYSFAGWDPALDMVTCDVTYTAMFEETVNSYKISFLNENGEEIYYDYFEYGTIPEYNGESLEKADDDYYSYEFVGWYDGDNTYPAIELPPVRGEATYTAVYEQKLKDGYYVIGPNWLVEGIDPTLKFVENTSTSGEYMLTGLTLTEGDAMKVVEVSDGEIVNWYPDGIGNEYTVEAAYADREVTIYFRPDGANVNNSYWAHFGGYIFIAKEGYVVKFVNDDGTEIETLNCNYNDIPACSVTPQKDSTVEKDYTFAGWRDGNGNQYPVGTELPAVIDDVTYYACYTESDRVYTIQFVLNPNDGETFLDDEFTGEMELAYGTEITEWPQAMREGYIFDGWSLGTRTVYNDGMTYTVTGDATFYGQFTITTFIVIWKNWDGEILEIDEDVPYGDLPSYDGPEPSRDPDTTHVYSFLDWTPDIVAVTGDVVYTATFSEETRYYTVTFIVEGESTETYWEYNQTPSYGSTPTKEADPQYTYTFYGWTDGSETYTDELPAVTDEAFYIAVFNSTLNKYLITFQNEDGTELYSEEFEYGTVPVYEGETPTKDGDEQFSYVFAGWDPPIHEVDGEETYTATFTEETNTYTVTWNNYDGSLLYEQTEVPYGTMPEYPGAENPQKPSDAQYDYSFDGWTPELTAVTGNVTYTAKFSGTLRSYLIRFVNHNGAVLQEGYVAYGEMPAYSGQTPEKEADAQYIYSFSGWTPDLAVVNGEATYTAQFDRTLREYTITFVNWDGEMLQQTDVPYGQMPSYNGHTPTREGGEQFTYVFDGWVPELSEVTGEQTYTAVFNSVTNKYTVTYYNWNGDELQSYEVEYGSPIPEYQYFDSEGNSLTPQKPSDAQYDYAFCGFDPVLQGEVHSDMSCVAQFVSVIREYEIIWVVDGETITETYEYGQTPAYPNGTPVKPDTDQYTYEFIGWEPEIVEVTGDATYIAKFEEILRSYYVTFMDEDGLTVLKDATAYPYGTPAEEIVQPDTPTKPDDEEYTYTFAGWYPELSEVTEDVIYYAYYDADIRLHTLTVHPNGAYSDPEIVDPGIPHGTQYLAPSCFFIFPYYEFVCWNTEPDGSGDSYNEFDFITVNSDIILYAMWRPIDGWHEEYGRYYYYLDGEVLTGVQLVPYPGEDILPEYAQEGSARFVFDPDTGEFLMDVNGVYNEGEDTYWTINGVVEEEAGLKRVEENGEIHYYYFAVAQTVEAYPELELSKAVKNGTYHVDKNNDLPLPCFNYDFDEYGVIVHDPDTSKNGISVPSDDPNGLFYMIDGVKVGIGLFKENGSYYYARTSNAEIVRSRTYWVSVTNGLPIEPGMYSFDAEGKMILNGFFEENGYTYYYKDGVLAKGFTKIDEDYYFFNAGSGKLYKSITLWVPDNEYDVVPGWYNFDAEGKLIKTGFVSVTSNGETTTYYYDNMVMAKGFTKIGDDYYFFHRVNGKMYHDITLWVDDYSEDNIVGGMYYFGSDGKMLIPDLENGEILIVSENGKLYLTIDGKRMTDGLYELDGEFYFAQSDGTLAVSKSVAISNKKGLLPSDKGLWYAFDENGKLIKTGFAQDNNGGSYYYVDTALATGLVEINGDYYFFNRSSGKQYKNIKLWISDDNAYGFTGGMYQFDEEGKMVIPE